MQQELIELAKKTLEECYYFNLATITKYGLPWNSPLYFTYDDKYNMYWGSAKDSIHSKNTVLNPNVFITVYKPVIDGVGLYFEAQAQELESEQEISEVLKILSRDGGTPLNNPLDFLGASPMRMYKAIPSKVYMSSPQMAEMYNGIFVEKRVEINLLD